MIAEFKLAIDKPASGKWEDTPVHETKMLVLKKTHGYDVDPIDYANYLSKMHSCEVRWNWQGSHQWHYVEAEQ